MLLAIVLISAGRPTAAAPDSCATCNRDCVAGCKDLAPVACKLVCEIKTSSCEPCKANSTKTCSAFCYKAKCQELQGCRDDVATLCRNCGSSWLTNIVAAAEGACRFECGSLPECWRCGAAFLGGGASSVRCHDSCVASSSSSDSFSSCVDELGCRRGGSSTSKNKCVRCQPRPGMCSDCRNREQKKVYEACLASQCVKGAGCTF